jgi:hypothetical protein
VESCLLLQGAVATGMEEEGGGGAVAGGAPSSPAC